MAGFIIKSKPSEPVNINWSEFSINLPERFSGRCVIYVDGMTNSIDQDIERMEQINKIPGLQKIILNSRDFRVAQYFDVLMRNTDAEKNFNLLNDMETRDRSEIDFSKLHYNEATVPFDYLMYGITTDGISAYNLQSIKNGNIIGTSANEQINYQDMMEKINNIADEIIGNLPIDELDDIDKSVLVSNWIQKNIQFIEGKVTSIRNKKYICEEFNDEGAVENIMTAIDKKYGVCNAIAKLSCALLTHPKFNCKCNMAHSPGHAYITQVIDGEQYVTDNTWCITRNPNYMSGGIKAATFSDEYLLIGEDKVNENENTLFYHTQDGLFKGKVSEKGIPRERIKSSIEKLQSLGVSFSYTEPPVWEQHEEAKENRQYDE